MDKSSRREEKQGKAGAIAGANKEGEKRGDWTIVQEGRETRKAGAKEEEAGAKEGEGR